MSQTIIRYGLLAVLLGGWGPVLAASQQEPDEEGEESAEYIGPSACLACHEQEGKPWLKLSHSRTLQAKARPPDQSGCEACHGPGRRHAETLRRHPLILNPDKMPPEKAVGVCLRCHQEVVQTDLWRRSEHGQAKLRCNQCHVQHQVTQDPRLLAEPVARLCFRCHPEKRAEFGQVSHHPVPEGRLECVDCHNPMGSGRDRLVRSQPEVAVVSPTGHEVNDLCLSCHAEKAGPFLYEHDPITSGLSDGCLTCHGPHGAPHDQLLRASVRGLCLRCHLDIATHPDFSFMAGNCVRCHVRLHGSNKDERFLQ